MYRLRGKPVVLQVMIGLTSAGSDAWCRLESVHMYTENNIIHILDKQI